LLQSLLANGTGSAPNKVINSLRQNGTSSTTAQSVSSPDLSRKDSPTSWDEFPNGRFGDARSPAYGDMDGYGVGLKLPVRILPTSLLYSLSLSLSLIDETESSESR